MLSNKETVANNAVKEALQAIVRTGELCERAEHGFHVLDTLADTSRSAQYAMGTVLGRS